MICLWVLSGGTPLLVFRKSFGMCQIRRDATRNIVIRKGLRVKSCKEKG
jgi:hypothetical protein